jgi:predicted ferric reductase
LTDTMTHHLRHNELHQNLYRHAEAATSTVYNSMSTTTTTSATSSSTIAPYTTALNGVNTPVDHFFQALAWWSIGIFGMLILVVRLVEMAKAHIRHMTAMTSDSTQQAYWARDKSAWWPKVKKHLLYAPLGKKRHNREFKLSSAINMGTLPSRFHTIVLGGYVLSNLIYCSFLGYSIKNRYEVVAELRGRSGTLAVINMIALVLLAGRNNPLITILKISFDTYNLLHRWMGRIIVLESCVHTLAWMYNQVSATGWEGVGAKLQDSAFIQYGFLGTVAMIMLGITTPSAIRHAFYETFLTAHIIFAAAAIVGVYVHCNVADLPQLPYVQAIIALWAGDRLARMYLLVSNNVSRKGMSTATIEALTGEACRVTFHLPTHVDVKPGSHAYLRFGSVNPLESHPFSIAWVEHHAGDGEGALPSYASTTEKFSTTLGFPAHTRTSISFVIHAQTGMTRALYNKAAACPLREPLRMKAALEGPYAGHHSMDSYGHCVLFAGSSGITHQIPFLKHLIHGYNDRTVATRRVTLVWIVRDMEHLEWVRPWMDLILQIPNRRDILRIKLFVTRPKSPREVHSPSSTVQMFPGRPNIGTILKGEVKEQIGAMCVTVCGPGGLADNVREAVRDVQGVGAVDFIEESFTW